MVTELAYSKAEGVPWEYFKSPLSEEDIMIAVDIAETGTRDFPALFRDTDCDRFYPDGDTLPRFHAILMTDGTRWDATNCEWARQLGNSLDHPYGRFWYVDQLFAVLRRRASWIPYELLVEGLR